MTRSLRVLVVGAGVGGISIARGLLREGHDVTVFERRPDMQAAGGAVTIWSNGATVLGQLGVDMDGAGQPLSTLRVATSTGRPVKQDSTWHHPNWCAQPVRDRGQV
jgi:FAD-dependent urate hydroxylase